MYHWDRSVLYLYLRIYRQILPAISGALTLHRSYHCLLCVWYFYAYFYPRSISIKFNFSFYILSLLYLHMPKIFIFLIICIVLTSCMNKQYQGVQIDGKERQNSVVVVKWMGVPISENSILTSAHVVRDDRLVYEVGWVEYKVIERDTVGDRALLKKIRTSDLSTSFGKINNPSPNLPFLNSGKWKQVQIGIKKWDPIYTEVNRSGSIMRVEGKVLDPSGSILGYDTIGHVETLSWIVLTDIALLPGDSWAPIYTREWELVDVVHVR